MSVRRSRQWKPTPKVPLPPTPPHRFRRHRPQPALPLRGWRRRAFRASTPFGPSSWVPGVCALRLSVLLRYYVVSHKEEQTNSHTFTHIHSKTIQKNTNLTLGLMNKNTPQHPPSKKHHIRSGSFFPLLLHIRSSSSLQSYGPSLHCSHNLVYASIRSHKSRSQKK